MAELPTPAAKRLQRPSWRDSRLIIGVVLVLLATVLGAKVISSADDTVAVYAAATALRPGDHLTADSLRRVDVQLGDETARYLAASAGLSDDEFAMRAIPEGELIPVSAVGSKAEIAVQPVTVQVDANSASGLTASSVVDVWVSPRDPQSTQERYLQATLMLEGVSVTPVASDGRFGSAASTTAVQIRVPRAKVADVIAAVDQQSRFTIVPVPGS